MNGGERRVEQLRPIHVVKSDNGDIGRDLQFSGVDGPQSAQGQQVIAGKYGGGGAVQVQEGGRGFNAVLKIGRPGDDQLFLDRQPAFQ